MDYSSVISSIVMPSAIFIVMLGIGLNIGIKELKEELLKPKALFVGLFCQMLVLPAIAFSLVFVFDMPAVAKVGLILLASAPGGSASNLITFLLKGRVALSVAMTSINSFLVLISIPLFTSIALFYFMDTETEVSLPIGETIFEVFTKIIVPVSLGVYVHRKYPDFVSKIGPYLQYILPSVLLIAFTLVLFVDDGNGNMQLKLSFWNLFLPALILNIGSMIIAYYTARLFRINQQGKYTIAIESGLQNSALAVFIAVSVIGNSEIATIAILYSAFSFFSTYAVAYIMKLQ